MKRWTCLLLAALLLLTPVMALEQPTDEELKISAPSAILMERSTGTVLYEKNADEHLSPASVTKIMTLLLIMEQLDSGQLNTSDIVTASAHASSMGGSQIWLKEGEQMSVDEMLKCIAVNSANDCAVAMAEHISGSEEAFAKRMNDRAKELGMENTQFLNCTGLTDDQKELLDLNWPGILSEAEAICGDPAGEADELITAGVTTDFENMALTEVPDKLVTVDTVLTGKAG